MKKMVKKEILTLKMINKQQILNVFGSNIKGI